MKTANEKIECPFCKKSEIEVSITPGHYSYRTARAIHQVKRIPVYHPEKIEIHSSCPGCGKSKNEIKEALESGISNKLSHEERLRRLREAGIPTKIVRGYRSERGK